MRHLSENVCAFFVACAVSNAVNAQWMHCSWTGSIQTYPEFETYSTGRFDLYLETSTLKREFGGEYFDINLSYGVVSIDGPSGQSVYTSNGIGFCSGDGPFTSGGSGDYFYTGVFNLGTEKASYMMWQLQAPHGVSWTNKSMQAFIDALSSIGTTASALPDANLEVIFVSSGTVTVSFEKPPGLTCYADLNSDSVVDDQDFVIFAVAYDKLFCGSDLAATCPADFNHDNIVEDGDFVMFVVAYNELLCPE